MKALLTAIAAGAVLSGISTLLHAQSAQALPIAGIAAARDVPGAKELPDPGITHKVAFDLVNAAPAIDDVNPGLAGVARYLNTLAKHGVPAERRQIAVVLHRGSTEIILDNETHRARNDGHDNPNIELIRDLHAAGVVFHVCGQAVLGRDIDPVTILPEIQLDLWALTTLINLELDGYVRIGG